MPEDLIQQAAQQVPVAGASGVGGALLTILAGFKLFAKPSDVELAKLELRAEMAEKYLTKEAIEPLREDIRYIRDKVDKLSQ